MAIERQSLIESDKDFLDALGLNEYEAAKALGRSRQSLYQAKLSTRTNYFKSEDLVDLVFAAKAKTPSLQLGSVYDYVEATRGPDALSDVRSVNGADTDEASLARYGEIWVVLPDFGYLKQSHPAVMDMLIDLTKRPSGSTTFFVSNRQDRALVNAAAGEAAEFTVLVQPWIGAVPYSIVAEPRGVAECFVFASGRFMRHAWYGGPKFALLLDALVRRGRDLDAEEQSNTDQGNPRRVAG